MPLLQNFPMELLEQIMRYLLPDDVDNFSDACETFRTITSKALPRHEELKTKYSRVACGFVDGSTLSHPLFLLREVLEDSEVVWYVKAMLIGLGEDYIINQGIREETWQTAQQVIINYHHDIIEFVHSCLGPYTLRWERQGWINQILSCDLEAVVVLLASAFPCLEEICYNGDYRSNGMLYSLAERIVEGNDAKPRASHALSKLKYIEEEGSNAERLRNMILFRSLPLLPSTRRYRGRYLREEKAYDVVPKKSSLTSLEFCNCLIRVPVLRKIFESIANLEEFTYEHHWAYEGQGLGCDMICWWKRWQPANIILSLVKFASHSLVKLDLTRNGMTEAQCEREARMRMEGAAEDDGIEEEQGDWTFHVIRTGEGYDLPKTFIGSLRNFQVLKNICVQSEAFVEEYVENSARGRTVHSLVDILPASAEHVVLALPHLCEEDSFRLMKGLPELKAERVPKLKSVIFESDNPEEWTRTVFKTDGSDLILKE